MEIVLRNDSQGANGGMAGACIYRGPLSYVMNLSKLLCRTVYGADDAILVRASSLIAAKASQSETGRMIEGASVKD